MGCTTVFSLFIQEPEELSLEELEDRVLLQKVLVKLGGKPLRLSETLISYGFKQPNGRGCTSYGFP